MGLQVEVEFSALYAGQPLFADVDRALRERGFVLWRFESLWHHAEQPSLRRSARSSTVQYGFLTIPVPAGCGQLLWGDAVYFRNPAELAESPERFRQLLVLAALLDAIGDASAAAGCLSRAASIEGPTADPETRAALREQAEALRACLCGDDTAWCDAGQLADDVRRLRTENAELRLALAEERRLADALRTLGPVAISASQWLRRHITAHPRLKERFLRRVGRPPSASTSAPR